MEKNKVLKNERLKNQNYEAMEPSKKRMSAKKRPASITANKLTKELREQNNSKQWIQHRIKIYY